MVCAALDSVYYSAWNHSYNGKYYQYGHDGLLNMTANSGTGTLVYSSKGYFLNAPYYVSSVNDNMGLRQPEDEVDDTFLYLEPYTGTVFKSYLSTWCRSKCSQRQGTLRK